MKVVVLNQSAHSPYTPTESSVIVDDSFDITQYYDSNSDNMELYVSGTPRSGTTDTLLSLPDSWLEVNCDGESYYIPGYLVSDEVIYSSGFEYTTNPDGG